METDPAPAANLAKLTDRFIAYLVDTLPFAAGYYATLVELVVRRQSLPNTPGTWRRVFWVWIGLYVLYHWAGNAIGATAGKWALGLRVRGLGGGRLEAGRALARSVGLLASTPLCNLGFLWAFVQPESRTWHDLLAGSRVVETRPKGAGESLLNALLSFALLAAIGGATWWHYVVRPTPYDLAAVEKADEGLRILAQIEERYKAGHGTYTAKLVDLAEASGDMEQFKAGLRELFDPKGLRIQAGRERFLLRARAKDRRRTVVTLAGP